MIRITETDFSRVMRKTDKVRPAVVCADSGPVTPRVIGKFPRAKYYGVCHRRRVALKKKFRAGLWQQEEFVKLFGRP